MKVLARRVLNLDKIFQATGYGWVFLIGALSLVPGPLRPDTGAPGKFEHLIAYLGAGMLLTLRPETLRDRWRALWLIPYAGALELLQLSIPGRHARFSDFVVSSTGAGLGMIAAFMITPMLSQWLAKPPIADRERVLK
jgi:VanZ family protein